MYRYKYGYIHGMPTSTLDVGCGYRPILTFGTYAVALTTRHPSHIIGKFTGTLATGRFSSEGSPARSAGDFRVVQATASTGSGFEEERTLCRIHPYSMDGEPEWRADKWRQL